MMDTQLDMFGQIISDSSATSSQDANVNATEIMQANGQPQKSPVRLVKPVLSPIMGYSYGYDRGQFHSAEYNLSEIGRIEDVENMVRQAFKRKTGLMFKAGYDFVGKNQKTVKYVKDRFKQIQQASDTPTQMFFRGLGSDLIRLSNVFVLKVRNTKASGGISRPNPFGGGKVTPIAAYFIIPAETVEIKRNRTTGRIEKYLHRVPDGRVKEFDADAVIHMHYDKRPGFNIGKPTIIPVIDDIRALRRIEQNVELLIYQHLFPLFHHRVGTKEQPDRVYADGTKEVDDVRDQIQYMPSEGSIVTSYRHDIRAIGAESRALRAETYLEHFKKRVIAGLGISEIDLGEGGTSNRSTSETLSRAIIDDVKDFQQVLVTFVNEYIIKELLLESTFNANVLDENNIVHLQFNEIDIDSKIKMENHMINAYQGHAVTETELRNAFGREPILPTDRDEMYIEAVMKKQAEFKLGMEMGSTTGGSRAAESADMPSNQYGQNMGPGSIKNFSAPRVNISDAALKEEFKDVISDIEKTALTGTFTVEWATQLLSAVETRIVARLQAMMNKSLRTGVSDFAELADVRLGHAYMRMEEYANYRVNRVVSNIKKIVFQLHRDDPDLIAKVKKIYESLGFRFDFILKTETRRAYLYGKALAHKHNKVDIVYVDVEKDACVNCQKNSDKIIRLDTLSLEDIPIVHDNCACDIKK